ncbi:dehydrogenase [Paenibacillus turpanensis]|uniref:dehydrogenase n=1 Tax=Paenibacillus turpanensis TaxID=2689078 RepID=UPI0014085F0E|nr:dehydrogenase [Paenibacillus turpanensis]
MQFGNKGKHEQPLPTARGIRRSCSKELYRTIKRLKTYIPPEKVKEAEELYFRKVAGNLIWIAENGKNRKKLSDWFDEAVADDIAKLWEIDRDRLSHAFRNAFGG